MTMESKKSMETQAKAIPKTAVLIAETLRDADASFPTCMAALMLVLTEVAIELELSREDLVIAVDESSKIIYNKHKEKGGSYVQ
jgi:hypothetical protein